MSEVSTMERVIRSDVSKDECKKIEKVLRKNNISYFERWKFHTGLLRFLNNDKNAKCDILVHMDSFEKAKNLLEQNHENIGYCVSWDIDPNVDSETVWNNKIDLDPDGC